MSHVKIALIAGLVAVVALAGLTGWLGFQAYQAQQTQDLRSLYLQVGRQGALNLTTIGYENAEADVQRILDSATGTFYDDFQRRAEPFVEVVKQAQSTSEGTIAEAGLDNARGVTCNANISLVRLFAEDSVERAYVHFPDPWFKKRHHKRRVIKTPLLDDLARILIEGGEFHFATDFEAYAEEALELIGRHPAYGEPTRCEAPFGILSDREAWHRSQDDPIYRYLFRVHGSRLPREESAGATARAGDDRPADAVDAEPPACCLGSAR